MSLIRYRSLKDKIIIAERIIKESFRYRKNGVKYNKIEDEYIFVVDKLFLDLFDKIKDDYNIL